MGRTAQLFTAGLVSIGIITALTLNGRNTVDLTKAGGNAGSKLLGTAITGKS